ncbi:MAG: DedA family protein [Buchnera aphidicola (Chaetogeoica yunlongensis)]
MEAWLVYLIKKSMTHALLIITIISFLESLALIGLILPGIVFMSILGTFIGNGTLKLYPAWISGIIGCMFGDWISYYLGWKFKKYLKKVSLLKKNNIVLNRTKNTLKKYPMSTIFIGRFIGPIRPLIPMVCGMLNISLKKFILPNIIGCILWPPIYFLPGIFAGIAINTTINYNIETYLKLQFFSSILFIWLGIFLLWKYIEKKSDLKKKSIFYIHFLFFPIMFLSIGIIVMIYIQYNPKIILIRQLLWDIFIK